jgi:WD40 repeat protein
MSRININLFENLINERRIDIAKCINEFLPKDVSKLISEYDYYLEGKSNTLMNFFDLIESIKYYAILCKHYAFGASDNGSSNTSCKCNIWNLLTGECYTLFMDQAHFDGLKCIAVTHDKRIVSGSTDRTLKLWNPETGNCDATFIGHTGTVYSLSLISDDSSDCYAQ